jgi:hypothetical protein
MILFYSVKRRVVAAQKAAICIASRITGLQNEIALQQWTPTQSTAVIKGCNLHSMSTSRI